MLLHLRKKYVILVIFHILPFGENGEKMTRFTVSSDSTCDLYHDYITAHDVFVAPHTFTVEKNGVMEDRLDAFTSYGEYVSFYRELREGAYSHTSMLNYEKHYKHFRMLAERGFEDVLHFTISSGLSPTKTVAAKAAADVKKDFPKLNVVVIDPLTATIGQGALVMLAVQWRDEGRTMEETAEYVNSQRLHIQHFIVANDLKYLHKGGRVSSAAATFGGMLDVKPIISFDNEGKLFLLDKVRGARKAVSFIKKKLETEGPDEKGLIYVIHTDNEPYADELTQYVREKFGIEPHVSIMGPVIGSHVGPGAFALGYISKSLRNTF